MEAPVLDLVAHRGGRPDEAGDAISVLVSLLAEGECWLPELVADARDQRYSWDAIATRLAPTLLTPRSSATYLIGVEPIHLSRTVRRVSARLPGCPPNVRSKSA